MHLQVGLTSDEKLNQPLLQFHEDASPELPLLAVNFDPALVRLLRETKYFLLLKVGCWSSATTSLQMCCWCSLYKADSIHIVDSHYALVCLGLTDYHAFMNMVMESAVTNLAVCRLRCLAQPKTSLPAVTHSASRLHPWT